MAESYLACSRMGIANVSNIGTYWLLTLYPKLSFLNSVTVVLKTTVTF